MRYAYIGDGFLSHNTSTSRLSSENPNAQNFPRKTGDPKAFSYHYGPKKLFTSRFGEDEGLIVQADYSQLELRIASIFSEDENLQYAYRNGKDLHIYVASKVYKIPESEVTDDQRSSAKAVGFGLIYGKGSKSLAEDIGGTQEEAERFIADYFKEFPGIKRWMEKMQKQVKRDKYVETLSGFRRNLQGIDSNDRMVVSESKRQSINSPVQGSGATLTLQSVIDIDRMYRQFNLKSKIIMTVHDSIVIDTHKDELYEVISISKYIMENLHYDWITVPIVADFEIGRNYQDLVKIELKDGLEPLEAVIAEGIFPFIDRELVKSRIKNYKKAGLDLPEDIRREAERHNVYRNAES